MLHPHQIDLWFFVYLREFLLLYHQDLHLLIPCQQKLFSLHQGHFVSRMLPKLKCNSWSKYLVNSTLFFDKKKEIAMLLEDDYSRQEIELQNLEILFGKVEFHRSPLYKVF